MNIRSEIKNEIVSQLKSSWRSYSWYWNTLWSCSDFRISLSTYYRIQKRNTAASAYLEKISEEVWKWWIYLVDMEGNKIEEDESMEQIKEVMSHFQTPTFNNFKRDYFTHYFASGEVYMSKRKGADDIDSKAIVLDSRMVQKEAYDPITMEITRYTIKKPKWWQKEVSWADIYNHIIYRDPDNPMYWESKYASVVYDATSSIKLAERNMYFFANSARPWVVLMLSDEVNQMEAEEIKNSIKKFDAQYSWSQNAHKTLASSWIKDVKVIDANHRDMQLLELDRMSIDKMGMVFQIDPRILGYPEDVWGFATFSEISKHSMEKFRTYQHSLEVDMNERYRKFVATWEVDFYIKLKGDTHEDRNMIEENQRKDIASWIITPREAREERWLPTDDLPEGSDDYYIASNLVPIQW